MTKLRIIGDIHGDYEWYKKTIREANDLGIYTFQIGDFGIGFPRKLDEDAYWVDDPDNLARMNRFGFGNHDNPLYANNCPGSVGYVHVFREFNGMWIGGADSHDKEWRTPGVNWWDREQLPYSECQYALETYNGHKPEFMFSHDGPISATFRMFPEIFGMHRDAVIGNRTNQLLDQCFESHKPKYWFFGHFHRTNQLEIDGTKFICVGEREYIDLDIDTFDEWGYDVLTSTSNSK